MKIYCFFKLNISNIQKYIIIEYQTEIPNVEYFTRNTSRWQTENLKTAISANILCLSNFLLHIYITDRIYNFTKNSIILYRNVYFQKKLTVLAHLSPFQN